MVSDSYSTISVVGESVVGGLVGSAEGPVIRCYSAGSVLGNSSVGGLAGDNKSSVFRCYWDVEASGVLTSAGGDGKTTSQMQAFQTFVSWGGCGNEGVWTIDDGNDYPRLFGRTSQERLLQQGYLIL